MNWFLPQQLASSLPNESGQFLCPQKRSSLQSLSKMQGPSSTPYGKQALNPISCLLTLLQSTEMKKNGHKSEY